MSAVTPPRYLIFHEPDATFALSWARHDYALALKHATKWRTAGLLSCESYTALSELILRCAVEDGVFDKPVGIAPPQLNLQALALAEQELDAADVQPVGWITRVTNWIMGIAQE